MLLFIFNLPPLEFRRVRALFRGVSCAVSLRVVRRVRYAQEPEPAVAGGVTSPSTPPHPPAAELCSSRAAAIGVREEFQQLVSEPMRFCGDVIIPGALGDSTMSTFTRSISTKEANA